MTGPWDAKHGIRPAVLCLALGLTILVGGGTTWADTASRAADRHEALGDEYFQRNRLREAAAEWRLALELDPARTELAERIAAVADGRAPAPRAGGTPVLAPADLDAGVARHLRAAETCYAESRLKEAELAWQAALAMDAANAPAQAGLRRLADEAYQSNPRRPYDRMTADLYEQGMQAYRQGDWEHAEIKLAEAAKLNPEQPQVKRYLAAARAQMARLRDQERGAALAAQAQDAERSRAWSRARTLWLEAAKLDPPEAGAAEGLSRTAQALAVETAAARQRGRLALDAGRFGEALENYQQVLAAWPADAEAASGAQRARAGLAGRAQAQGEQTRVAQRIEAGAECKRRGDLPGAVREWEAALAADPQNAALKADLAQARGALAEERVRQQRRAQARYEDGLAAYQRGELDAALTAWKETLELDPEHVKARANLRKLEQEMK